MSADARVARAIQEIRRVEHLRSLDPYGTVSVSLFGEYASAVNDLIAEAKDALHLTDDDVNRY